MKPPETAAAKKPDWGQMMARCTSKYSTPQTTFISEAFKESLVSCRQVENDASSFCVEMPSRRVPIGELASTPFLGVDPVVNPMESGSSIGAAFKIAKSVPLASDRASWRSRSSDGMISEVLDGIKGWAYD